MAHEQLLVPVSGTRNLGGELGSCAIGLRLVRDAAVVVMCCVQLQNVSVLSDDISCCACCVLSGAVTECECAV